MAANPDRQTAAIHLDQINTIVSRRTGLSYGHVLGVGERIAAGWDFSGDNLPALQPQYLTRLLLALAADVEPEDAVSTARSLHILSKRRDADAIVDTTAGMQIEFMLATMFTSTDSDLLDTLTRSEIEVSAAIPRAVRVTLDAINEVLHFNEAGQEDSPSWRDEFIRQNKIIPGRVLLNIVGDVRYFWEKLPAVEGVL